MGKTVAPPRELTAKIISRLSSKNHILRPKWSQTSNSLSEDRTVLAWNQTQLAKYATNKIRTTKYTPWTWLPVSLLYQFKRLANIYFLIITILSFLPLSPKSASSFAGTFAMILMLTSIKEAYEDVARHDQDRKQNLQIAKRSRRSSHITVSL